MLKAYKDIIKIHNSSDALKKGSLVTYPDPDIVAFKRSFEQKKVLVLVNVRNASITYDVPVELENSTWKDAFDSTDVTLSANFDLGNYEYRVLQK